MPGSLEHSAQQTGPTMTGSCSAGNAHRILAPKVSTFTVR